MLLITIQRSFSPLPPPPEHHYRLTSAAFSHVCTRLMTVTRSNQQRLLSHNKCLFCRCHFLTDIKVIQRQRFMRAFNLSVANTQGQSSFQHHIKRSNRSRNLHKTIAGIKTSTVLDVGIIKHTGPSIMHVVNHPDMLPENNINSRTTWVWPLWIIYRAVSKPPNPTADGWSQV